MADAVAVRHADDDGRTCRLRASILLVADDQKTVEALHTALGVCDCDMVAIPSESGCLMLIRPRSRDCVGLDQSLVSALGPEALRVFCGVATAPGAILTSARSLMAALAYAPEVDLAQVLGVIRNSGQMPNHINSAALGIERLVASGRADGEMPTAIADRWAWYAMKGCTARCDPSTIRHWASECAVSYSTLTEMCRLNAMKPLYARDFVRVLRALRRASSECSAPDAHLAVSDSRTLRTLSRRAGIDLETKVRGRVVPQFLVSQQFLDSDNDGLRAVSRLVCDW